MRVWFVGVITAVAAASAPAAAADCFTLRVASNSAGKDVTLYLDVYDGADASRSQWRAPLAHGEGIVGQGQLRDIAACAAGMHTGSIYRYRIVSKLWNGMYLTESKALEAGGQRPRTITCALANDAGNFSCD